MTKATAGCGLPFNLTQRLHKLRKPKKESSGKPPQREAGPAVRTPTNPALASIKSGARPLTPAEYYGSRKAAVGTPSNPALASFGPGVEPQTLAQYYGWGKPRPINYPGEQRQAPNPISSRRGSTSSGAPGKQVAGPVRSHSSLQSVHSTVSARSSADGGGHHRQPQLRRHPSEENYGKVIRREVYYDPQQDPRR